MLDQQVLLWCGVMFAANLASVVTFHWVIEPLFDWLLSLIVARSKGAPDA